MREHGGYELKVKYGLGRHISKSPAYGQPQDQGRILAKKGKNSLRMRAEQSSQYLTRGK